MKYWLLTAALSVAFGLFSSLAMGADDKGPAPAPAPKPDLAKAQQTVNQVCAA